MAFVIRGDYRCKTPLRCKIRNPHRILLHGAHTSKKTLFVLFSSFFWHSCIHFIILLVNIAWLLNLLWTKEYALSPPWCAQLSLYLSLQIRNPHRTPGRRTQCPFKNNLGRFAIVTIGHQRRRKHHPTNFFICFLSFYPTQMSSLVLTWCSARRHCVSFICCHKWSASLISTFGAISLKPLTEPYFSQTHGPDLCGAIIFTTHTLMSQLSESTC